jgi:hypothetical protein
MPGFDVRALYTALDRQRRERGLSWTRAADDIWELSAVLNARRQDHPISVSTITTMPRRADLSCQHALFMLRWLERAPEDFVIEPHAATVGVPLPEADVAHRLRWSLSALYEALNAARKERGAGWQEAAQRLHCTTHQLTGLRTAKFATGMRLAMRICQALRRPAADFIYVADW